MTKLFLNDRFFYFTLVIFFTALIVRFLYFPGNVHFSFDQARDSFTALEILKGHLKLIGPPSFLSNQLFSGPLIFYIYAPIYFLFNKSPEAASAIFRIWNALGVFLVFFIGSTLFNKRVGIIAAIFFAFSYEQSQYSLFLSHQPLAVITVLLFYLGLSLYLFQKRPWGIVLSTLGLGLSIQFHYGFVFLISALLAYFIIFKKKLFASQMKWILLSFLFFISTISTFILTELKYHFLSNLFFQFTTNKKVGFFSGLHVKETLFIINRFLHDSFFSNYKFTPLLGIIFVLAGFYLFYQKQTRAKAIFLIIWFFFGLSPYVLSGVSSYYYSPAASVSLILLTSYFIDKLFSIGKILLGLIFIFAIVVNNLLSIFIINPKGLNPDVVIQPDMTTSHQKKVMDYIYLYTQGQPFAVRALTIPLSINTTWSYLFQWYGKEKYGYLPFWIGPTATGYAGDLTVINARSQLPKKQFIILEPPIGIREIDKENFFKEEGYFTKIIEERKFGSLTVQIRQPY